MAIWNILWIFYDHLVHSVFIWYIFPIFGNMYQEKSGNPDADVFRKTPVFSATWSRDRFLIPIRQTGSVARLADLLAKMDRTKPVQI
jgi:hypothetical protein